MRHNRLIEAKENNDGNGWGSLSAYRGGRFTPPSGSQTHGRDSRHRCAGRYLDGTAQFRLEGKACPCRIGVHDHCLDQRGFAPRSDGPGGLLPILGFESGWLQHCLRGIRRPDTLVPFWRGVVGNDGGQVGAGTPPGLPGDAASGRRLFASGFGPDSLILSADLPCAVRHRLRRDHGCSRSGSDGSLSIGPGHECWERHLYYPDLHRRDFRQDGDCRAGLDPGPRSDREGHQRSYLLERVVSGFSSVRAGDDVCHLAAGALALSTGEGGDGRWPCLSRQRTEENGLVDKAGKEVAGADAAGHRTVGHRPAAPHLARDHRAWGRTAGGGSTSGGARRTGPEAL